MPGSAVTSSGEAESGEASSEANRSAAVTRIGVLIRAELRRKREQARQRTLAVEGEQKEARDDAVVVSDDGAAVSSETSIWEANRSKAALRIGVLIRAELRRKREEARQRVLAVEGVNGGSDDGMRREAAATRIEAVTRGRLQRRAAKEQVEAAREERRGANAVAVNAARAASAVVWANQQVEKEARAREAAATRIARAVRRRALKEERATEVEERTSEGKVRMQWRRCRGTASPKSG